ncbi:MAG: carboxyltransferase domain-containing protein [Chlorobia bacterium]|nr:carboxyltransferase domain-containing protein [Fimbriimonadaceae bacterium]
MRIERLGEKALILRDLPCESFRIVNKLNHETTQDQGLLEAVASYETVGLYFQSPCADLPKVHSWLSQVALQPFEDDEQPIVIELPVCYEMGEDLDRAARQLGISPDNLIEYHLQNEYTCYAVGFSPGFAYLGYLSREILNLPRLSSPRVRVEPGSVGITGRQTAVYPSATPGGWNLIGRCPLELVNVEDEYFPVEAGNRVSFVRVDEAEFTRLKGERL